MSFKFSEKSLNKLKTCHEDLQKIMKEVIKYSEIDFTIVQGKRSLEDQQKYYKEGKSKLDGMNKRSKHQGFPTDEDKSYAIDICAYVNKASWDKEYLIYLNGVIMSTAKRLYNDGIINHELRSGANWDRDNEILTDQSFIDLPHYELVE